MFSDKKTRILWLAIFSASILAGGNFFYKHYTKGFLPKNLTLHENTKYLPVTDSEGRPVSFGSLCSISLKGETHALICNYGSVYLMDTGTGQTHVFPKPDDVKKWQPTGLCWHEKTQTLYVANYTGHDVLLFTLSLDQKSLIFQKRFTDPEMKSPEGIDVSRDGTLFTVADYDGKAVFLFDQKGRRWKKSLEPAYGHGVTFDSSNPHCCNKLISGTRLCL